MTSAIERIDWRDDGATVAVIDHEPAESPAGDDAVPAGGFRVVLADPPWAYDQKSTRLNGTTDRHYPVMTEEEIASLPVEGIAADHAILLLWTTWPFLPAALRIIERWGFTYITGLPWVKATDIQTDFDGAPRFKPQTGVGFWFRGATEPLLLAKRGTPPRLNAAPDGILSERNIHSRKPSCVYDLAEALGSPRIELFARQRRDGWSSVGHGVDGGADIGARLREMGDDL